MSNTVRVSEAAPTAQVLSQYQIQGQAAVECWVSMLGKLHGVAGIYPFPDHMMEEITVIWEASVWGMSPAAYLLLFLFN